MYRDGTGRKIGDEIAEPFDEEFAYALPLE
jgi:hypothetical protein